MDIVQDTNKISFFSHVFSTTEEGKAEILNIVQYSMFGVVPIVILNKLIQKFVPEADPEKNTLEILIEIFIQLIVMFCGIVIIHRIITFFPTYSGFKYENLVLTNVILAFLIIVLSIQTKLGIKVNILFERLGELWNGPSNMDTKKVKDNRNVRVSQPITQHIPSQSDYLDHPDVQSNMFPQAPTTVSTQKQSSGYDQMMRGNGGVDIVNSMPSGPMAANSLLGSTFGAF
jgi:hypothetical protein